MINIILPPNPFISRREHETSGTLRTNNTDNNIPGKITILEISLPIIQDDNPRQTEVEIEYINIRDNELMVHTKQGSDIIISMNIESIKFIKNIRAAIKEKLENP